MISRGKCLTCRPRRRSTARTQTATATATANTFPPPIAVSAYDQPAAC